VNSTDLDTRDQLPERARKRSDKPVKKTAEFLMHRTMLRALHTQHMRDDEPMCAAPHGRIFFERLS